MAKTDGIDRDAAQRLMNKWRKVEEEAQAAVAQIGGETKDKKETILEAVERQLKVTGSSFKKVMKKDRLLRQAVDVRAKIEDIDLLAQFDSLNEALDLPLFDVAGVEAPKAKRRRRAIEESENVTEMPREETAA